MVTGCTVMPTTLRTGHPKYYLIPVRTKLGLTDSLVKWVPSVVSLVANVRPLTAAKVKNEWSCASNFAFHS
jgi:hypothetical protein